MQLTRGWNSGGGAGRRIRWCRRRPSLVRPVWRRRLLHGHSSGPGDHLAHHVDRLTLVIAHSVGGEALDAQSSTGQLSVHPDILVRILVERNLRFV